MTESERYEAAHDLPDHEVPTCRKCGKRVRFMFSHLCNGEGVMTIDQFRRDLVNKARANRDDQIERYESDRDAAVRVAHHDCRARVKAADDAFRREVEAINLGEFDHEHSGDAV